MSDKIGTPKQLIADLRPGGWVMGHSGVWPRYLRLHKTDLIADLQKLPETHSCFWRIVGDATATGRYDKQRRTIVVWLGK